MNRATAVITGGGRGIGKAASRLFGMSGYNVVLTYINDKASAESTVEDIIKSGGEGVCFKYDAVSSKNANELIAFTSKRYGKIDALICNSGISFRELATETTDEDWDRVISTNLTGTFYLCRAAAKEMLKRKEGHIVNVASVYGITGAALETAYSASKAGIIGFTKALAKELALSGISVNCVAPGVIDTGMNRYLSDEEKNELREKIPQGRFGTAEEVAKSILYFAGCGYITGQILCPDGGIT